jgi:uncharacterized protein YidB (DUF937 family)
MALLDILTGNPNPSGRVPPLARGLMGLLSYGKLKDAPAMSGTGQPTADDRLEEFFKPAPGGGPTAHGVVGALLTGGLMDLVAQFRGAGKSAAIDSWVSRDANHPVSPAELSTVLSEEQIAFLMQRTGMSREELLAGLSERLPKVVDALTPEGRVPTADEMQRRVSA